MDLLSWQLTFLCYNMPLWIELERIGFDGCFKVLNFGGVNQDVVLWPC